ncbi:MAG: hypothetical protein LBG07_09025, partial [Treponema sp.]|nr:hypothetical protein [Treponema sp.]
WAGSPQVRGEDFSPELPPSAPPAPWEELYRRFLDGGFLIPPGPGAPLILPGSLSPGEEAKLAALLGKFGG